MDSNNDKQIILEQYKIYSEAKEKFIDRQFSTNRFYLVLNIIIMVTAYILSTLTPQYQPVIVLSIIGLAATLLWWMNIDSYQVLIKVKYSKVLEYIETMLPTDPYRKEFAEYQNEKRNKKLIVFGDFQKALTLVIACVYFIALAYGVSSIVRYQMM